MISALLPHLEVHAGRSVLVVEIDSVQAAELVQAFAREVCPIALCASRTSILMRPDGASYFVSIAFPDARPEAPLHVYDFLQVRCLAQCTKWGIRGVLLDERGLRKGVPA